MSFSAQNSKHIYYYVSLAPDGSEWMVYQYEATEAEHQRFLRDDKLIVNIDGGRFYGAHPDPLRAVEAHMDSFDEETPRADRTVQFYQFSHDTWIARSGVGILRRRYAIKKTKMLWFFNRYTVKVFWDHEAGDDPIRGPFRTLEIAKRHVHLQDIMWNQDAQEGMKHVMQTALQSAMTQFDAMESNTESTHRRGQTGTGTPVVGGALIHCGPCSCGTGEFNVFHNESIDTYELDSTCDHCRGSYFVMPTKDGWQIEEI